MPLGKNGVLSAADFIALKTRIQAEMNRRNQYGSLATYGGTAYNFTTTPATNAPVKVEHGQKTVDLLLRIKDIPGLQNVTADTPVQSIQEMADALTVYEKETVAGNTSSCRGACTGLCLGGCGGTCNGCSGCTGCSGWCDGGCVSCGSDCGGSCQTCGGNCNGTCKSCGWYCGSACGNGCNGCTGCGGSCSSQCTGCKNSCSTTCSTNCNTACQNQCFGTLKT